MVISVADRGPGIPPADRERVFDKFYRVLETQTTRTTGSGLGLAVSRGLVEAHGGRIWEENRDEGGAIFRFTLPISNAIERNRRVRRSNRSSIVLARSDPSTLSR